MALHRRATPRLPRRRVPTGVVTAVFLITLAGCGGDARDSSGDTTADDPSASSESTPSETAPTETSEASETATDGTTGADPSPAGGLAARLLTADELPGVNDETSWTVDTTGAEDGRTTGACQRFDLVSLGASEAVVRTFTSNQDTVEAAQVVARFADDKSAWRAHRVLTSWRKKCAEQVDASDVEVGELRALDVSVGNADAYVVRYGEAGAEDQHWAGAGISRRGPLLSLVQIDLVGQDYNYPAGEEPAALAAMSALGDLG